MKYNRSHTINTSLSITCLFTNAQSILNKLPELQAIAHEHSSQIVARVHNIYYLDIYYELLKS